jgi:hypothetical protein
MPKESIVQRWTKKDPFSLQHWKVSQQLLQKGAELRARRKQAYKDATPGMNNRLDMFGGKDAVDVVLARGSKV